MTKDELLELYSLMPQGCNCAECCHKLKTLSNKYLSLTDDEKAVLSKDGIEEETWSYMNRWLADLLRTESGELIRSIQDEQLGDE